MATPSYITVNYNGFGVALHFRTFPPSLQILTNNQYLLQFTLDKNINLEIIEKGIFMKKVLFFAFLLTGIANAGVQRHGGINTTTIDKARSGLEHNTAGVLSSSDEERHINECFMKGFGGGFVACFMGEYACFMGEYVGTLNKSVQYIPRFSKAFALISLIGTYAWSYYGTQKIVSQEKDLMKKQALFAKSLGATTLGLAFMPTIIYAGVKGIGKL